MSDSLAAEYRAKYPDGEYDFGRRICRAMAREMMAKWDADDRFYRRFYAFDHKDAARSGITHIEILQ